MKKITLLISAMSLVIGGAFAQNSKVAGSIQSPTTLTPDAPTERSCGTMDMITQQELDNLEDAFAPQVAAYLQAQANGGNPEAQYTIPVIVHIIHNSNESVGQGRNVAYARVTEQIQTLNDDFGKTNSDAGNAPAVFQAVAADFEINFCLVTKYPTGHPMAGQTLAEVGVDRVDATTIGMSNTTSGYSTGQIDGTVKPATSWNPNEVMNIWVCQISGGILGYAQFPNSGSANTDGVVTLYSAFGITSGAYGLGRTTTHEVGHWVNLRHIWGDANCGNDQVADTPTQQSSNFSCPSHPSATCGNSGDMFMNYMDYVNDNCMVMFTAGQKARAQSTMASAPRRSTLNAASATLCGAGALTANFNESATTINVGQTVTFTDASSGPNAITSYSWNFDVAGLGGVTPSTANTVGPHTVTYNMAGVYSVSLMVGDGSTTDTKTKTSYITVNPAGTVICDSTTANWDWVNETFGAAYWAQDAAACTGGTAGLIVGNNCYGDNGWASKVSFSGAGKELTDVIYVFVRSEGSGAATLTVWDADGAGKDATDANVSTAPGTIMKTQTVSTGDYSGVLNQFVGMPITPAIPLTGDFYIGYDHPSTPAAGDTLAMGLSQGSTPQAWANESGIGWRDIEFWGTGSGQTAMNYKGTVIAVICDIASGEIELAGQLNNVIVYPNPSVGTLNIALTQKTISTVTVLNMLGEEIYSLTKNTQLFTVDVNDQPNGVYFIRITSGDEVITKKVLLSK